MHTIEEMGAVVEGWFRRGTATYLQTFVDTPVENLSKFHDSVGRMIRNEFKLWDTSWTPELDENGCDCSLSHPDQISMEVIKEAWHRLKGQK